MREQYAEELRLLRKGYSLANVSKLTGTAINTLRKVKYKFNLESYKSG